MADTQSFSMWLLRVFVLSALLLFFLWLSLRPSAPTYTIVDFSVTDKNGSFSLEIANKSKAGGVCYSAMNLTIYFHEERIGTAMFPQFYQKKGRTTQWNDGMDIGGTVWEAVSKEMAHLKVEVVVKVRYKIWLWRSRLHWMDMVASIPVGRDGEMSSEREKMHRRYEKWRARMSILS